MTLTCPFDLINRLIDWISGKIDYDILILWLSGFCWSWEVGDRTYRRANMRKIRVASGNLLLWEDSCRTQQHRAILCSLSNLHLLGFNFSDCPFLVIFDGLKKCSGNNMQAGIVKSLAATFHHSPFRIRLLIPVARRFTSRPHPTHAPSSRVYHVLRCPTNIPKKKISIEFWNTLSRESSVTRNTSI